MIVLDSTALLALATDDKRRVEAIDKALASGTCVMAPEAAAEAYYWLLRHAGRQFAEHWLDFVTSGAIITIYTRITREFIEAAGEAQMNGATPIGSFSAALAHLLQAPLMTSSLEFRSLADSGFCKVKVL